MPLLLSPANRQHGGSTRDWNPRKGAASERLVLETFLKIWYNIFSLFLKQTKTELEIKDVPTISLLFPI